jgi:hypothetical protein
MKQQQQQIKSPLIYDIILIVLNIIPIMSAIIVLNYLGPTFSDDDIVIESNDWRRKWLIFFAWFSLVSIFMTMILIMISQLASH